MSFGPCCGIRGTGRTLERSNRNFFWGPAPGTNFPSIGQKKEYNLAVSEIAKHYALSSRTVRDKLNEGALQGVRVNGIWRCSWQDVWAAEKGPEPRRAARNSIKLRF
jgi:hypothetical protein